MNTNYKKYIRLPLIATLLLFSACDDRLEIEPAQSISEEQALSTEQNVQTVLTGAYDIISSTSLFGGGLQMDSELLAADGELVFSGTYNDPSEIWRKEISTVNLDVTNTWMDAYDAINTVNNVLSALEVVSEGERDRVEGEAKFIRGLLYFELARFYAQPYNAGNASSAPGIPLVVTPTRAIDESLNVSRSSLEETYQQAISDLMDAETLLPARNGIFASSTAAAAVLSRVYLQQQDYANAATAADRAIQYAEGNFNLLPNIEDVFNQGENTPEDIFAIQVTTQDGTNGMQLYFGTTSAGGRGDIEIQNAHFQRYEEGDQRADLFYTDAEGTRTAKWFDQFANVQVIRLAELYLTRAEANLREGTTVGASPADDLNRIRRRAGLEPIENPSVEDVISERFVELAFEGQKIHDIKRLEQSTDGFNYDANLLVFPIPQREMNANPALEGQQNPGY